MAQDELDLAAVQRDAQTIQALASRAPSLLDQHDAISRHLAAWVEEIDRGIDPSVVVRIPPLEQAPVPSRERRGRRMVGVAGATVVALVISSGAAAAVTGDPLAAVKAPIAALKSINPFADDHDDRADRPAAKELPAPADTNRLLAEARRAIAQGDLGRAAVLLDQARATGDDRRVDRLTVLLDDVVNDQDPVDKDPVDKDPVDKDPQGGKGADKDPVDKDPVDKDPQGGKGAGQDPAGSRPGDSAAKDKGSKKNDASDERGSPVTRPGAEDGQAAGSDSGSRAGGQPGR